MLLARRGGGGGGRLRRRHGSPAPTNPTQPGPNLGEISPSPIRRPPLIRSSPGEGARDLATRSGPGSGLGDLGCALRSFQIRSAPERLGLGRLQSSVASIFFWCVAVESDRFEFPACCWQLRRRGRSLVVGSSAARWWWGRCPGDASGWDGFAGLGSVCRRSIGAGAAMYHVAPSSKQAGSLSHCEQRAFFYIYKMCKEQI